MNEETEGYVWTCLRSAPTLTVRRVSSLEKTVEALASGQYQIQSTLHHILTLLPPNKEQPTPTSATSFLPPTDGGVATANIFQTSVSPPQIFGQSPNTTNHLFPNVSAIPSSPQNKASGRLATRNSDQIIPKEFPKLPGFAPPVSCAAMKACSHPESSIWHIRHHSAALGSSIPREV